MTRYADTTAFLFSLQRMSAKLGLDNIIALLEVLERPERRWPALHVAGTNGKGSTAAMLESVLRAAGYRVGLYTSPHLVDFTERIRVDRVPIPPERVIAMTETLRSTIDRLQPSFFEVATAMAFRHFADAEVDVAVVETGMGGRLDSTNVVAPLVTLISPVGLDHQQYLGDTMTAIAAEKGGIIKAGVPCITANRDPGVLAVLAEICEKKGIPLERSYENRTYRIREMCLDGTRFDLDTGSGRFDHLFLNLPGDYQLENLLLAVAGLEAVAARFPVTAAALREGLGAVRWPGRLERVCDDPPVLLDVSHNPEGMGRTLAFLNGYWPAESIEAVVFLQEDKDYRAIAGMLASAVARVWAVRLPFGKPLPAERLAAAVREAGGRAEVAADLETVRRRWSAPGNGGRRWLIIGSHYLAGAAYGLFQSS